MAVGVVVTSGTGGRRRPWREGLVDGRRTSPTIIVVQFAAMRLPLALPIIMAAATAHAC